MTTRVLVTGASGFLGRHVVGALVARGHEVHAVSRRDLPEQSGVRMHVLDLLDSSGIEQLLEEVRPTYLVHCAWETTPGHYLHSMSNVHWVEASVRLLRRFIDRGGERSVFLGSCFEYEWGNGPLPEDTPRRASSVYGASKAALGELVNSLARLGHLDAAWVRPFFTYGPYEDPRRFASSVVISVLRGEPAPISHGRQRRDYMYAGDVGDAIAAVLESGVTGPVNIGTGEVTRIVDLARRLARQAGDEDLLAIGAIEARPDEPEEILADVSVLRERVGWRPPYGHDKGVALTVDYWRSELELG